MVHPSRKTVWSLLNCFAVFWIWLSTVHWFQLLLCVWVLFLFAGKCACYYQLAMVTGERCTIIFLPEKLKKHILKGGLCNEGGTQLLLFFYFISRLPERMTKNPRKDSVYHDTSSEAVFVSPFSRDRLSWSNNIEEKISNPFWYTLNQQTFLFVMVEIKTDFLSKNPFSVFCKCSGITHLKWLVYFQWFSVAV